MPLERGALEADLAAQLEAEADQVAEGAQDDPRVRAGRLPAPARQVGDAHLSEAVAAGPRPRQQLGRDHGAIGGERHALEGRAAEQAEGPVDVAGDVAEQAPDQQVPAPAVQAAQERVAAAKPARRAPP